MTNSNYDSWIFLQLEPDQATVLHANRMDFMPSIDGGAIMMGNAKRYDPIMPACNSIELTEGEKDRMNEELIKLYGV